jgi:hypothetical protein
VKGGSPPKKRHMRSPPPFALHLQYAPKSGSDWKRNCGVTPPLRSEVNLPQTAFPRYMPMVGPNADSALNPGMFISILLIVLRFQGRRGDSGTRFAHDAPFHPSHACSLLDRQMDPLPDTNWQRRQQFTHTPTNRSQSKTASYKRRAFPVYQSLMAWIQEARVSCLRRNISILAP